MLVIERAKRDIEDLSDLLILKTEFGSKCVCLQFAKKRILVMHSIERLDGYRMRIEVRIMGTLDFLHSTNLFT